MKCVKKRKNVSQQHGFSTLSIVLVLLLIAAVAGGWYYYQQQQATNDGKQQFITEPVKRGTITYTVNASGMVYPKKTVEVGAQVSGEISQLTVAIGDMVKKGDVIAEIDASTKENAKRSAQAQLRSQQATLATAKSTLSKSKVAYTRAKNLYQQGAGTKADYEAAEASLNAAKNAIIEAEANIRQSQLTIKDTEVTLGYTRVTAPISGTVIAVPVEKGQTVNAAQSAPTLVTIAQTDVMTVKAEIAEADVAVMTAGLPVSFTLLGKNSSQFTGVLNRIDPAPKEITDDSSITSSTAIYYYGHIDIPNTDNKLRYGMTATISITIDKAEDALIIPMTAINDSPRGAMVMVLKDNRPKPQPITVGLEDGVNAQVLSGLAEGDKVVISSGSDKPSNSGRRQGPPGGMF